MTNLVQLGKHLTFKNGKSSPERANHLPYPVYGSNGLIGYADQSNTEANTLIIGRVGSYCGSVHFSKSPCWVTDNAIICRAIKEEDVFFWYSILSKYDLNRHSAGSGQPLLNQSILKSISLHLVNEEKWAAIGSFLSKIYDKIELNRQMNETLEEMARSTFKSWFVDFDPVVAKAAGQAPAHMSADTAALFPATFNEKGLPDGWEEGLLGNVATNPKRIVKPDQVHRETPYIGLEHMPRKSVALGEWEFADKVTSTKTEFKKGEFLFGKLRPYFHKVGIAPINGICSTDIVVVAPKQPHWSAFTLACISTTEFVNYTNQASTGTKMPRTSWKIMSDYSLVLPPKEVAEAFENFANPLLQKITANIHQNNTLADLRDTLLPKLMSGEIRLRDVEKAVEDQL